MTELLSAIHTTTATLQLTNGELNDDASQSTHAVSVTHDVVLSHWSPANNCQPATHTQHGHIRYGNEINQIPAMFNMQRHPSKFCHCRTVNPGHWLKPTPSSPSHG